MGSITLKKKEDNFELSFTDFSKEISQKYSIADPQSIQDFIQKKVFEIDGTVHRHFEKKDELLWKITERNSNIFSTRFRLLLPYILRPKLIFECLFPFQKEGVSFLLEKDACILADDMGLGKTVQTITALIQLFYKEHIKQAWIFCPNNLLNNWEIELKKWSPQFQISRFEGSALPLNSKNIILFPYSSLQKLNDIVDLTKVKIDVAIADEAHKLRNSSSKAHEFFRKIGRHRTWFLTGTPLERDISDIRNTISLLKPKQAGSIGDLDEILLKSMLKQITLRRLKSDKLKNVPSAIKKTDWLTLDSTEQQEYKKKLTEMRKAESHTKVGYLVPLRKFVSGSENINNVKQQRCLEIVTEACMNQQKCLVFSNFNDVLDTQIKLLKKNAIPAFIYNGQISLEERQLNIKKFKEIKTGAVMLLNAKSGSEGLTFTEATIEVFIDEWWNPSNNEQAEDRAIRIGQKNIVTIYKLRVLGSLDTNLGRILDRKIDIRNEFIEDLLIRELEK